MAEERFILPPVPGITHHLSWSRGRISLLVGLVLALVGSTMVLVACSNNPRTTPAPQALNVSTAARLVKKWTDVMDSIPLNSPTVIDGVVYANVGSLDALDATTGRVLWSFQMSGDVGTPTVVNSIAYVESFEDQTLHALKANSGSELWSFSAGGDVIEDSPLVVNGVVYFGTTGSNNKLYALNATTGQVLWTFQTNDEEKYLADSLPVVVNGVVYICSFDGNFYALDAASGQELWSFQTSGIESVIDSPMIAGNIVYVDSSNFNSVDQTLHALDAKSGQELWSFQTDTPPTVDNGVVYVGSIANADKFYALDAASGRVLWSVRTLGYVLTSPRVVSGVAYFSSLEDSFYAVNAVSGHMLWTVQIGGPAQSSPTVADGVVYINTSEGDNKLYALNATSGQKLWSFHAPSLISGSPVVANSMVYDWWTPAGADPNNISYIYAFGLPKAG